LIYKIASLFTDDLRDKKSAKIKCGEAHCGEDYVDAKVTAELLRSTEELFRAGTQVDIRRYASAA